MRNITVIVLQLFPPFGVIVVRCKTKIAEKEEDRKRHEDKRRNL